MIWTIVSGGTEKTVADWGLVQLQKVGISQAMDTFTFRADGASADGAPIFSYKSVITLYRDRIQATDGTFSGGTPWFTGIVLSDPRDGSPAAESVNYLVGGPWWYLENCVFQNAFQNIFLGYTIPNDPASAQYGVANSSHLFLGQADGPTLAKLKNGQVITQVLNFVLKPFIDAGVNAPFQFGTISPAVDMPIDEVRDLTCAEVVRRMMRWSPDATVFFDHTTLPPKFNALERTAQTTVNIPISSNIKDLRIRSRRDLRVPSVQIIYETVGSINGQQSLTFGRDFYPNPLPTDPNSQFSALLATINLQGVTANNTSADITTELIDLNNPAWWIARHQQLQGYNPADPSDAGNQIAAFAIEDGSEKRLPNPVLDIHGNPIKDLALQNELKTGQISPWMNFKTQRITVTCKATIGFRNGTVIKGVNLSYQCLSTNATSGTYTTQTVSNWAEPQPFGLAQSLYNALNVLQFEGSLTFQEEEVSAQLKLGNLFNITGSANADWSTMQAMVQSVTEDIDKGTTTVTFGPAKHLSPGELVDWLRTVRGRLILSSYSMRGNGQGSGGQGSVALGDFTPEKNSASALSPPNPHVISATADGTGAVITHAAAAGNCSTTWGGGGTNPATGLPNGNISIRLSDAGGQTISIQPISICLNAVQGKMYFLCGGFIPD